MADFCAHYIFGQIAQKPLKDEAAACAAYPVLFNWGCQGPDILFCHKALTGGSPLPGLGDRLHDETTGKLFELAAAYVGALSGEERRRMESYFYGFVCHYSLDCLIHPYVYFHQNERTRGDLTRSATAQHYAIERDIDMDLHAWYFGLPASEFRVAPLYTLTDDEANAIARFFCRVLLELFGASVTMSDLRDAFRAFLTVHKLEYAPSRLTRAGAQVVDFFTGEKDKLASLMKAKTPGWDSLNLGHAEWAPPQHPDAPCAKSVPEILDEACAQADDRIAAYAAMFAAGQTRPLEYTVNFSGDPLFS